MHVPFTSRAQQGATVALLTLVSTVVTWPLHAQIPEEFTNLQVLPERISRDSLLDVMRGFSLDLNVRCQYCHVGGDGISFEGVEFDRDDDPDKRKARFMMRMTENLNRQVLPLMPERDEPPLEMQCKTCHRGLARPTLLTQDLGWVIDRHGVDSAAVRYRMLRDRLGMSGAYDFGEWEMNTLAERLQKAGRFQDAIGVYALNAEFFPESVSIAFSLGGLYEVVSDTAAAIRSYERVLELQPGNERAQARLDTIRF
jgi:hypothetical protein